MKTKVSLLLCLLVFGAQGAPMGGFGLLGKLGFSVLNTALENKGGSESGMRGGSSSFTPGQFGTTGGESFGGAGSKTTHGGGFFGYVSGFSLTDSNVDTHDSSYNNANGAGSSTRGSSTSHGSSIGGFSKFGGGSSSSSSNAEMNSRAQTIWNPNSPFGPSGSMAQGGGIAGANANSLGLPALSHTKSSVNTDIRTFGSNDGSGSTGSVTGSSRGAALFGSADSSTAIRFGSMSQHAGQFGASLASAGGEGGAKGNSGSGLIQLGGLSFSNSDIKTQTFAGNGISSSSFSGRSSSITG